MPTRTRKDSRRIIHERIRKQLRGTAERPRLVVHFSNKRVYAQVIDDDKSHTLVQACTRVWLLSSSMTCA